MQLLDLWEKNKYFNDTLMEVRRTSAFVPKLPIGVSPF